MGGHFNRLFFCLFSMNVCLYNYENRKLEVDEMAVTAIRKTDERKYLYKLVRTKYEFLPEEMTSKAIDRMMYLLLEKA